MVSRAILERIKSKPAQPSSPFFHLHAHSRYSAMDAMPTVELMVAKTVRNKQPGLALTDHGNMGGAVRLYRECKAAGIKPFVGVEGYLIDPAHNGEEYDGKAERFHIGLIARSLKGYKGLVRFVSLTHTRPRFNRFPRFSIADLASFGQDYGDDIILTTGCYFGLMQQRLVNKGERAAQAVLLEYLRWFPHTVVELQHHNTPHDDSSWNDDELIDALYGIAQKNGAMVMATQDSHYLHRQHKGAHELLKRMFDIDAFPGDSYHLSTTQWVKDHYPKRIWSDVEDTARHLLDLNELEIPPLDKYEVRLPKMAKDPMKTLTDKCNRLLDDYLKTIPAKHHQKYRDRLAEELSVIEYTKTENYHLLVDKYVHWCKKERMCIEARGSGNGSLVNFVLGVTQVDPLKWGTVFERYLSRDRIKPPDIDMDVEDVRREELIAMLAANFDTIRVGTWSALGASPENPERGSALVSYQGYLRRLCEERAAEIAVKRKMKKSEQKELAHKIYNKHYGHVQSIEDVQDFAPEDYEDLAVINDMDSVCKSYGVHAGGILIGSDDLDIHDYVPTMLVASSETQVSQYDMDDVEHFGWQKLDILGQASLTILRRACELAGRPNPIDFSWIPSDPSDSDPAACKILREGRTGNGIFHYEGWTRSKGGKEMGIKNVMDAALGHALYMPGAMDTGQTAHYIKYRKNPPARARLKYHHPIYEKYLAPTFGAVIYQEQPLQILRDMGMDMASINILFKVLKDSGKGAVERNAKRLTELRKEFNYLCMKHGISNTEEAWKLITGFVAYGFNSAHAAGYGIRSYRFAYLKAHYQLEFMTAVLESNSGKKKEPQYIRETRRLGVRVLSPDVNISGQTWTIDRKRGAIRRGLLSIAGVGEATAAELASKAPFADLDDLVKRCLPKAVSGGKVWTSERRLSGRLADLNNAGALDGLKKHNGSW